MIRRGEESELISEVIGFSLCMKILGIEKCGLI
jgi:hypothetical protein